MSGAPRREHIIRRDIAAVEAEIATREESLAAFEPVRKLLAERLEAAQAAWDEGGDPWVLERALTAVRDCDAAEHTKPDRYLAIGREAARAFEECDVDPWADRLPRDDDRLDALRVRLVELRDELDDRLAGDSEPRPYRLINGATFTVMGPNNRPKIHRAGGKNDVIDLTRWGAAKMGWRVEGPVDAA